MRRVMNSGKFRGEGERRRELEKINAQIDNNDFIFRRRARAASFRPGRVTGRCSRRERSSRGGEGEVGERASRGLLRGENGNGPRRVRTASVARAEKVLVKSYAFDPIASRWWREIP